MKRKLERELWAYRDGELSPRARERVRQELEADPENAARLRRLEAFGAAIRESWSEGPRAPSPDFMIHALRPELARIDEELAANSPWQRARRYLGTILPPIPTPALAGSVVAVVLLLVLGFPLLDPDRDAPSEALANFGSPGAIYDLNQGRNPLLVYELDDGVTVIWMLDEQEEDSISRRFPGEDRWV